MSNLSITPDVTGADGTGESEASEALGLEKTISVAGTFTGAVIIEASQGQGFVPVASFMAPGQQTLKLAAVDVRVVRRAASAIPGSPVVTISANDDGAQSFDLPMGSPGSSVDTKAFGTINSIVVDEITGILTFTGQPADGETFTIGNKVYTFQTTLTDVDGNIEIGTDLAESIYNITIALTLGGGSGGGGFAYASSMTANTDVQAVVEGSALLFFGLDGQGTLRGLATVTDIANASWNNPTMDKTLSGVVKIQTSEDNTVWNDLCGFQTPGIKTLEIVQRYVRTNHVNNETASSPTAAIAAINDDTAHKPLLALVPGASVDWEVSDGTVAHLILTEDANMENPTNCEPGMILDLIMEQDGTGGWLVTWGTAWQWAGGTDPVISAGAGAVDKLKGTVLATDANGVATRILTEFAQAFAD